MEFPIYRFLALICTALALVFLVADAIFGD